MTDVTTTDEPEETTAPVPSEEAPADVADAP
jgi:hypothetical protein